MGPQRQKMVTRQRPTTALNPPTPPTLLALIQMALQPIAAMQAMQLSQRMQSLDPISTKPARQASTGWAAIRNRR